MLHELVVTNLIYPGGKYKKQIFHCAPLRIAKPATDTKYTSQSPVFPPIISSTRTVRGGSPAIGKKKMPGLIANTIHDMAPDSLNPIPQRRHNTIPMKPTTNLSDHSIPVISVVRSSEEYLK